MTARGAAPCRVGVYPASARTDLERLLGVLEQAYPVRFEARAAGEWGQLDALVCLGDRAQDQAAAAAAEGVRALALLHPEATAPGPPAIVETTTAPLFRRALRGARFPDTRLAAVAPLAWTSAPDDRPASATAGTTPAGAGGSPETAPVACLPAGADVLATRGGEPLWARAGLLELAAAAPLELEPGEALRERFEDGRCIALMPFVNLLRELTDERGWQLPAPRATLLLDDPNLHWPSYGYLRLPELAAHTERLGYHVALAMIPLDAWFAHPRSARLLREHPRGLSLLVHGNDHTGRELGQPATETAGVALAAQALRLIRAFERRFRVPVSRVMAPPHEACSEATVRGLARCGFDAISTTRPYPWLAPTDEPWLTRPAAAGPLTGWGPADVTAGGLPVLLRHPFAPRKPHELALRAFLGQPLIVYGHHGDLADGLEAFEHAVDEVAGIGPTRWCSLGEMARTSFAARREGETLRVRMHSRRVSVDVPEGVTRVAIELPPDHDEPGAERVLVTAAGVERPPLEPLVAASDGIDVPPGGTVELTLRHARAVHPHAVGAPRVRPLAVARRVAGETRDRALPLLARAGRG